MRTMTIATWAMVLAAAGSAKARTPHPRFVEPLAMTFSGTLACADCSGLRTTLVLKRRGPGWAEGTYRLTQTYVDKSHRRHTKGDWTTLRGDAADDDATVYELDPDHADRARHFLRIGRDAGLQALTSDLKPLPKGSPDRLRRVRR